MRQDRSPSSKSLARRLARACSVLFYAVVAGAIIWLAVTRWNGVPADPSAGIISGSVTSLPIDPGQDRTAELIAALGALPPAPALTLPPAPPGMRWKTTAWPTIEVSDALAGAWTPETRPNLQGVIAFLETPGVDKALARIGEIEPGGWRPLGPRGAGVSSMRSVRDTTKLFVARARYHHAGRADIHAALADLEAACRLTGIVFDSGELIGTLVALACEELVYTELRHLARGHDLTPGQAARIIASIRATTPDIRSTWQSTTRAELTKLHKVLNLAWTDDGQGNGWLVLAHLNGMWAPTWAPQPRNGAWNLLSLLFNDRRTVAAKITRLGEVYEKAAELPYNEAIPALETLEAHQIFNLTDGPLGLSSVSSPTRVYEIVVRKTASRRAAVVMVALSAYRHDHGRHPLSLDALRERGYLETIPLDPFVARPLRYRQEDHQFILYSVGPNGIDDGGKRQTNQAMADDLSYSRPRREPWAEPVLEEVAP